MQETTGKASELRRQITKRLTERCVTIPFWDSVAIILNDRVYKGVLLYQTDRSIFISNWRFSLKCNIAFCIEKENFIDIVPSRIVLVEKYILRNADINAESDIKKNDIERKKKFGQFELWH
jgi:hypothetical protein